MNKQQRLTHRIAVLALAGFVVPLPAFAQDNAKAAALATEAITAKESGDLITAKAKYEELLKINPSDESAKSLLAEVNKSLLNGDDGKSVSALDKAAAANLNLFREVESASIEASDIAAKGNPDGAIALLDQAAAALPDNTAGQVQKEKLLMLRNKISAARDNRFAGGTPVVVEQQISNKVRESKSDVTAGRRLISEGRAATSAGRFADADAAFDKAAATLPNNETAESAREQLMSARAKLFEARYSTAIDKRDINEARLAVEAYESSDVDDERAAKLRADFEEKRHDSHFKSITDVSPDFAAREKKANEILAKARAQYLYGDYLGALESYKDVLQYQPYNTEAKSFSVRIRQTLHEKSGRYNTQVTREKLLEDVDDHWAMPEAFDKNSGPVIDHGPEDNPIVKRMKSIKISTVTLRDMDLDKAIETLGELSLAFDPAGKGVNFQLIDPEHKNPKVSLVLRELPLNQVLDQVLRSVGYAYTVNEGGVVEIKPSNVSMENETEFFSLTPQAFTRMTGVGKPAGGDSGNNNPFGGTGAGAAGGGSAANDSLKAIFANAGIEFSQEKGTGLNYDGVSQLMVTNTRRSLDRIRMILRKYSDVKQVNIESKFIDVTQGTLNQIAANWTVTNTTLGLNGTQTTQLTAATGNRTVASAFSTNTSGTPGKITSPDQTQPVYDNTGAITGTSQTKGLDLDIPNRAPAVPGSQNFGSSNQIAVFDGLGLTNPNFAGTFYSSFGIGGYDIGLYIQAIEEATGSDLMAAPSLTVTNGQAASIKVAQRLRYPTSYSQIQAQVSQGGGYGGYGVGGIGGGGSNASVAITAGTPQDFEVEDVGVKMEVTPTVSDDNETIGLDLRPTITEFEGFVEYGGTSVAIAGGTVVTVPSGFFQPVFSVRSVETKVTVYDGATVIIGGLTREQVQTVHDKVPVLGDLPLVGKLFQSNGKTSTKRNLMIFVTANMISPTGSPARTSVGGVRSGTTFSNPTLALPSGPVYRSPVESAKAK